MVMMPLQTAALNSLPLKLASHGSAMFNTMRQVAGSIGTAALITVMSKSAASFATKLGPADVIGKTKTDIANHVLIHGIETAFLVAGILSVVACVLALFIQKIEVPWIQLLLKPKKHKIMKKVCSILMECTFLCK